MLLLGKYGVRRLPVLDSTTGDISALITQRYRESPCLFQSDM